MTFSRHQHDSCTETSAYLHHVSQLLPIARGQRDHRFAYRETIRRAALTACINPCSPECDLLGDLSAREWTVLLSWLDVSGLALYLFDQLTRSNRCDLLPAFALAKLQRNFKDNIQRTTAMIEELSELNTAFNALGFSFTLLKGLSLVPLSVGLPWLRSQADIDFLIAERDAAKARQVLENRGFHLHAISGRSWEFRTGPIHTATLENMYRVVPFRSVELHLETRAPQDSLLARTEQFTYNGSSFRRLAPVDLMLGQGLHLYKHVCSEFFRASHVLEFHNHIAARAPETSFWRRLQIEAERDHVTLLKLGVATLLAAQLCGRAGPAEYLAWTVDRLPAESRLWVERYGIHSAFCDPPGSKSYLLLQAVMKNAGAYVPRSTLRALLPSNLPRLTSAPPNETWPDRLRRYRLQLRFAGSRFRFHVVEGIRYLCESIGWSRERNSATAIRMIIELRRKQRSDNSLTHS